MKINRQDHVVVIGDGTGARLGLGVLVPAILVGVGFVLIWPPTAGHTRFDIGALMFVVTAVSLAVLNSPRSAEFDLERREVRLSIGWPPVLGRRKTIAFDTIREAKVRQLLRLDDDLGAARPALVLKSGKTILLSTYKRSPKRCRVVVEEVRHCLDAAGAKAST